MVRVKICGLTCEEDLEATIRLGADYAGFIFFPPSPRCLSPKRAAKMLGSIDTGACGRVGVFVNEEPQRVQEIFNLCRLDLVQLHGDESPEYCRNLGLPYWKALRPKHADDLEFMGLYPNAVILLDTWQQGSYGGTGRENDTEILKKAVERNREVVIAGGVSTANIARLLELNPFGIDVNSSLEVSPGKKSPEKMREFFKRKKEAEKEQMEKK